MLKIKLFPTGKKHQRSFRIVVAEAKSKFNGNFVDAIGFYTPQTKTLQIDKAKLQMWVKNGAQITLGVNRLLDPKNFPKKSKPIKPKEPKEPKAPKPETTTEVKVETEIKPEVKAESEVKVETKEETPSA